MTTQRRTYWITDFSVGFVLFVATLVTVTALFLVGGSSDLFGRYQEFELAVPTALGIKPGSPVSLSGVSVGTVSAVDLVPAEDAAGENVILTLSINPKYTDRIRRDSVAWLQTEGLLGDTVVHIGYGTAEAERLPRGDRIVYKPKPLLAELAGDEFTQSTSDLLQSIVSVIQDLNQGKGTLGQLLKNESLYKDAAEIAENLARVSGELGAISEQVKGVLEEVRSRKGALGKLIGDPALYDAAVDVVERLDGVIESATAEGTLVSRVLTSRELAERFERITARLESSTKRLDELLTLVNEGGGSVSMLLHDPSLAASLRNVALGIQEYAVVRNVVRNAEAAGYEIAMRNIDPTRAQEHEVRRLRNLERFGGGNLAVEEDGAIVPAAMRQEEKSDSDSEADSEADSGADSKTDSKTGSRTDSESGEGDAK